MSRKWLERTEKLFGEQTIDDLSQKTVAVLGLGGVGGAAAEAVCRMGVGKLVLIDNDTVDITNLNRQLFATADMVGQSKCLAAKKRLLSINPDLNIICYERFFLPELRFSFRRKTRSNPGCNRYRHCKTVSGTNLQRKKHPAHQLSGNRKPC
jgi:tRNA A37 threonylcarbamoyladenosine dehydratase